MIDHSIIAAETPTDGSLHTILVACAVGLILVQAWQGWHLGLARALTKVGAFIAGYAAGYWTSPLTPGLLRPMVRLPDFAIGILGASAFGMLTWIVVSILGILLFKKTKDQPTFVLRWVYGASGASVGALTGCVLVWILLIGLRFLGTVAESQLAPQAASIAVDTTSPATGQRVRPGGDRTAVVAETSEDETPPPQKLGPVVHTLANIKQAIDQGFLGATVQVVDPIPEQVYILIGKIGRMSSDAKAATRFFEYPGGAELASHPRLRSLLADPAIRELASKKEFAALLQNQKVIDASNDPEVNSLIKRFDIEAALDYALHEMPSQPKRSAKPPSSI